jgi:hypothetical protein
MCERVPLLIFQPSENEMPSPKEVRKIIVLLLRHTPPSHYTPIPVFLTWTEDTCPAVQDNLAPPFPSWYETATREGKDTTRYS